MARKRRHDRANRRCEPRMRLRLVVASLVILVAGSAPAWADDVRSGTTLGPNGDPVVYVGTPGSGSPGGPSGGGGSVTCNMLEVSGTAGSGITLGVGGPAIDPVE